MRIALCACALLLLVAGIAAAAADPLTPSLPPGTQIPDAARPGPDFDADRATDAYLALLTPEQRARSDAYFEGGYWLNLWGTLIQIGICILILRTGWSVRLRNFAVNRARSRWLQSAIYGVGFILLFAALQLPWTWYTDYLREHQYGLSNLSLGRWSFEQILGLVVSLIVFTVGIVAIYGFIRRAGTRWVAWATAFIFVFQLVVGLSYPVFIAPLFNDFKPLPDGEVREAVLSLARANSVPTDHVAWFDASKQTDRVSANVSGFLGTTRVSLNDNLLNKTSLPEIKAVMGHEMGHYVLNHALRHAVYSSLILGLVLLVLDKLFNSTFAAYRARLGISERADPAGLPLAGAIFIGLMFFAQPFFNRMIYVAEVEADAFGVNASQEPYGRATVNIRQASYRKLDPGPVEEFLFYDHPSGRYRVHAAMLWVKEHQALVAEQLAAREAKAPAN
jgi:STE24 endopeptidase